MNYLTKYINKMNFHWRPLWKSTTWPRAFRLWPSFGERSASRFDPDLGHQLFGTKWLRAKDANLLKLSQFIASHQRLRPQQTLKSCCKQCLSYSTQWILLGHVFYFGKRICPRIGGIKIFARLKTDCLHFYFKNGLRLVGGPANSD